MAPRQRSTQRSCFVRRPNSPSPSYSGSSPLFSFSIRVDPFYSSRYYVAFGDGSPLRSRRRVESHRRPSAPPLPPPRPEVPRPRPRRLPSRMPPPQPRRAHGAGLRRLRSRSPRLRRPARPRALRPPPPPPPRQPRQMARSLRILRKQQRPRTSPPQPAQRPSATRRPAAATRLPRGHPPLTTTAFNAWFAPPPQRCPFARAEGTTA